MASFRGFPCCSCLAKWLPAYERELLRRGLIKHNLDVFQLTGRAGASAGTHAQGGAFDLAQFSAAQLRVARDMGADATWHRRIGQGFDLDHAHGVLRGCPHNAPARYQIAAVDDGFNGLGAGGRGGRDDGPRPLSGRTWSEGIAWANAQRLAQEAIVPGQKANPKITPSTGVQYLNIKGGDDAGKATIASRATTIMDQVGLRDIFAVVECPTTVLTIMDTVANAAGYKRIGYGRSAAVYARKGAVKKVAAETQVLKAQYQGREEAVLHVAYHVKTEKRPRSIHVHHADVYATDANRLKGFTEVRAGSARFARRHGVWQRHRVIVADHNTVSGAVIAQLKRKGWRIAVSTRRDVIAHRPLNLLYRSWSKPAASDHPLLGAIFGTKA